MDKTSKMKVLKKKQEKDWWDLLTKAQREDIEAGLKDLRLGRKKSREEVLAKYGVNLQP
jgi:hypothetical protein